MGNCIKKQSSSEWGGEDWSDVSDEFHKGTAGGIKTAGKESFGEEKKAASATTVKIKKNGRKREFRRRKEGASATTVKIKITKKQLEEILGKSNMKGLSVQQVLAEFMKLSHGFNNHQTHHSSWKPCLKSIPESDLC